MAQPGFGFLQGWLMDFADHFWLLWWGMFLVLEIPAALFRPRWTFSAHVWKWFGIGKNWRTDWAGVRWFILAGLLIAVLLHFLAFFSALPIIVFAIGAAWSVVYHYRHER